MNSLYTLGVRQTNSLQADLERFRNGDNSPSLIGQISASLAALHRTVDDYDSMAKREMIKSKQEKAQMRVQKFRSDYAELRAQFERTKAEVAASKAAEERNELLNHPAPPTPGSSDTRRRFTHQQNLAGEQQAHSESPFRTPTPVPLSREHHALNEHSFLQNADTRLDEFIAHGRGVLDDLMDQRGVLKGTQKKLLDAANTLGLSRDVIGWIERRSTQDMYIFIAGTIFTFFCFFLIWRYLG